MSNPFSTLADGQLLPLPDDDGQEASVHRWSQREIDALTLAHAARRPLLLRGEPGTGKTQVARAAARHLGWALLTETIHPRYEAADLIYRFDAVRRLADAQAQCLKPDEDYWQPGALWQAYGWHSASRYGSCRGQPQPNGHVVLIDEIDKADSDLPNSLLDVLGQRRFAIPALGLWAGGPGGGQPLVLVTTNEERELPNAFLRRCVVLNLEPDAGMSYRDWLLQRGQAHFGTRPGGTPALLVGDVMRDAADQLVADRRAALDAVLAPPGPAEYLDLLAAIARLAPGNAEAQRDCIRRLSAYAFVKHGTLDEQPLLRQDRSPQLPPGAAA